MVREIDEMEFNKILSAEEFCRRISLKGSRFHRGVNSSRNSNLKYLRLVGRKNDFHVNHIVYGGIKRYSISLVSRLNETTSI